MTRVVSEAAAITRVPWHKRLSVRVFVLTVLAIFAFNAVKPSIVRALQRQFVLDPPEDIHFFEHVDEDGNLVLHTGFPCETICANLIEAGVGRSDFTFEEDSQEAVALRELIAPHAMGFMIASPDLTVTAASPQWKERIGLPAFSEGDNHPTGFHILQDDGELQGWIIFEETGELPSLAATDELSRFDDWMTRSMERDELISTAVSWTALFVLAAALSFLVSRLVTVRLTRLANAASARIGVAASSDAPVYNSRGGDEIAMLARSLNAAGAESSRLVGELDERDAKRRRFIAQISHDLRTPLTALTACLDRAKLTTLGSAENERVREKLLHTLEVAEQDASRVRDLTADLLELARLDLSSELRLEPVLPGELVARAVTGIRPLADSQGLRIEPDISPVIETIEADGNRLMRVLENLLRNAIRHARSKVVVSVEPTVPGGDAVFSVSDDGPGFPVRNGEPVLTRQPSSKADSRDADSAGLGLTIARRIVESHAGTLSIENAPDSGAVVRFRIPAGPNAHEPKVETRSARRNERAS